MMERREIVVKPGRLRELSLETKSQVCEVSKSTYTNVVEQDIFSIAKAEILRLIDGMEDLIGAASQLF